MIHYQGIDRFIHPSETDTISMNTILHAPWRDTHRYRLIQTDILGTNTKFLALILDTDRYRLIHTNTDRYRQI